jgi:hypothetical protein
LFVHAGGWRPFAFNMATLVLLGSWVERLFGPRRWLLLYFVPGVVGQLAGYAWQPSGAGASVACAGLAGALSTWLLAEGGGWPWRLRVWGGAGLLGASFLTILRDIHGPPILAGAALAILMVRRPR